MSRTKAFRREMRAEKIRKRRNNICSLGRFGRWGICGKLEKVIYGEKGGYLSKGHYGGFKSSKKTKTKNAYASYRHKGGYGKSVLYSRHDKAQIEGMEVELKETKWRLEDTNETSSKNL